MPRVFHNQLKHSKCVVFEFVKRTVDYIEIRIFLFHFSSFVNELAKGFLLHLYYDGTDCFLFREWMIFPGEVLIIMETAFCSSAVLAVLSGKDGVTVFKSKHQRTSVKESNIFSSAHKSSEISSQWWVRLFCPIYHASSSFSKGGQEVAALSFSLAASEWFSLGKTVVVSFFSPNLKQILHPFSSVKVQSYSLLPIVSSKLMCWRIYWYTLSTLIVLGTNRCSRRCHLGYTIDLSILIVLVTIDVATNISIIFCSPFLYDQNHGVSMDNSGVV